MNTSSSSQPFYLGIICGAAVSTSAYYIYQKFYSKQFSNITRNDKNDYNDIGGAKLGPPPADIRYSLNLVGAVDNLYNEPEQGPKPFRFNKEVVDVFDDMVSRSVPLYSETIDFLLYMVAKYYQPNTNIYDLGCSTGTTFDYIIQAIPASEHVLNLIGIDESDAMINECKKKLEYGKADHNITIIKDDICNIPINNASICILNYTLQFVKYENRDELLHKIYDNLNEDGILFISEKVRSPDKDIQNTCVYVYEDFKHRRGYTKEYIANKKNALENVLIPYTEQQIIDSLYSAGFDFVQTCVKWNCFLSIIARKRGKLQSRSVAKTPNLNSFFDSEARYLNTLSNGTYRNYEKIINARRTVFYQKGRLNPKTLDGYDNIAKKLKEINVAPSKKHLVVNQSIIEIGLENAIDTKSKAQVEDLLEDLKPWRKGPWNIFGVNVDSEWRSDWKWERILKHMPKLKGKVICDVGCGNGYFLYRMLNEKPEFLIGLDPNLHAWLEYQVFQHFTKIKNLKFELLRGEHMDLFPQTFDVVFCLGVLYHTPDPVGMLRKINSSLKSKGEIVVDCQGIEGEEDVALFPKKKYANMKGVYFLPTISTLKHWLTRSGFINIKVFFAEPLSTEEQRRTEWANVRSLKEALSEDQMQTIEGYSRPLRYYLKARRGGSV